MKGEAKKKKGKRAGAMQPPATFSLISSIGIGRLEL
jgi:hypothetical protein